MKWSAFAVVLVLFAVGSPFADVTGAKPWETWQPLAATVPQPNAFDTYLKAFALKREIDAKYVPEDSPNAPRAGSPKALPPPPPQPPPPVPPPPRPAGPTPDRWLEGPPNMPLPARLALYDGVLALVREGLKQECLIPAHTSFFPDEQGLAWSGFRSVERLLVMEAEVRRLKGDNMGAANSALDGLALAQAPMTQRSTLGYLVGIACEAITLRNSLDATIPLLTAPQCRTMSGRMLQIGKTRPRFAETLAGDETSKLASLKGLIGDAAKQGELLAGMQQRFSEAHARWTALGPDMTAEQQKEMADARQHEREYVARWKAQLEGMDAANWQEIIRGYEALQQYASLPYLRRPLPPKSPDSVFVPRTEDLTHALVKEAQALTWLRQRELQLAVRGYLLEHNQLLPDLQDLVPGYLPQVPNDPFGDGPMKSIMGPRGLAVYSIGPDGVDDKGKPTQYFFVAGDSKGDMVVVVSGKP